MNPFEMVVAIVLVVMAARVLRDRYRARAARALPDDEGLRAVAEEVRALRERVQVLERVVTESHGSIDLDRAIERLRDR